MKHLVFYRTNDVFLAEERLQAANVEVEVVPTPVQDKAYCGVCVRVTDKEIDRAITILESMEFIVV